MTRLFLRAIGLVCLLWLLRSPLAGAQAPWTVTVTPTMNPLPVGTCGAVWLKVFDPLIRDTPRNPSGAYVTIADFDLTVSTPDGKSVVGQYLDRSNWSVCACQGATAGAEATITATYPGQLLTARTRVANVAFQTTATFQVAPAKGDWNPPGCPAPTLTAVIAVAPLASAGPVPAAAPPPPPPTAVIAVAPLAIAAPVFVASPAPAPPGPVPTAAQGDALQMSRLGFLDLSPLPTRVSIGSLTLPPGNYFVVAKAMVFDPSFDPRLSNGKAVICQFGLVYSGSALQSPDINEGKIPGIAHLGHARVFTGPATVDWQCGFGGTVPAVIVFQRTIIAVRVGTVTTVP